MGEKLAALIFSVSIFFGGAIIAFWKGPIFTLICGAYSPIFIGFMFIYGGYAKKITIAKLGKLHQLGANTEETFSAMKLVLAFAREDITLERYDKQADSTKLVAVSAAKKMGIFSGGFFLAMFFFNVYTFGVASVLVEKKYNNPLT